jgi:hypothetical protein
MKTRLLHVVVLERDLPNSNLRRGDLGTVVEVYEPDGVEVEFLDLSGDTRDIVTLNVSDVRVATQLELARRRKDRADRVPIV